MRAFALTYRCVGNSKLKRFEDYSAPWQQEATSNKNKRRQRYVCNIVLLFKLSRLYLLKFFPKKLTI
jgi:hypothetical protein